MLYRFQNGADGGFPNGGVALDANGGLYGTTVFSIFHLDVKGKLATLYTDTNCSDGNGCFFNPDLTVDAAGTLFGTKESGGDPTCNCGVVFKFVP